MIVVDTNVVAGLLIESAHTQTARTVFQRDPVWAAPLFWRSELRNVLARYVKLRHLPLSDALVMQQVAEELFSGHEYPVDSTQVMQAAATSGCSAYDCEFLTLAHTLGLPLVTSDQQMLTAFPNVAVAPSVFANGKG